MGEKRSGKRCITDLYGNNIVSVDDKINGIVTIDVVHRKIHEGKSFIVTKAWSAVADGGEKKIQIETDATTSAHMIFDGAGGGDFYGYLYLEATHEAGTVVVPMNMDLGSSEASTSTVLVDPSGGADGTAAQEFYFPGGTKNSAVGSGSGLRNEYIIPPNTKVLASVKNAAGSEKSLWMGLEWYEITS